MHLRSVTLKGFKSFPDRTRLEFGPGVSVIVGPNGSGKSNVTDAVLWAMGEQSPLAVRGKHRKRRRRAQLKLERTQDNLDRALDIEREARSRLRPLKRQAEAAELHERLERQSTEARWELARDELRARPAELAEAEAAAADAGRVRAE